MKTLKTERLILRPWKDKDLIPLTQLNLDPRVMEYFPRPFTPTESKEILDRFNSRIQNDGFSFAAAELQSTGEFIGFIGLNRPAFSAPFMPCVEIGWRIAFEHWGKGYATEGALAALEYGFNDLGLKEIVSFTAKINERSRRVMEKIGMKQDVDGSFEHPNVEDGDPLKTHVLYRLVKNPE
jgi:3-dehydroquinate dehydratase/shikimate dehydrogenase